MRQLVHGSTFSGIGGPEVAADMLGWRNAFHCEINPFGRKVLDYYYPESKSYEDITKTDFSEWRGRIDVLTGGFPCQPFSYAGKRRGTEDDRYLWPYMLRCIEQIRPTWFVGENVGGIATMVFPGEISEVGSGGSLFEEGGLLRRDERFVLDEICEGLERAGYSVQPMLVPACAVGAPHRRDRIFIIAHRRDSVPSPDTHIGGERSGEPGEHEGESGAERICGDAPWTEDAGHPADTDRIGLRTSGVQSGREGQTMDGGCEDEPLHGDSGSGESRASAYSESEPRQVCGDEPSKREPRQQGASQLGGDDSTNGSAHSFSERLEGEDHSGGREEGRSGLRGDTTRCSGSAHEGCLPEERWRGFPSISPVHRGNDGLPFAMDDLAVPFGKWKTESLKAYGNAIVPQVMYEIFRAINEIENQ